MSPAQGAGGWGVRSYEVPSGAWSCSLPWTSMAWFCLSTSCDRGAQAGLEGMSETTVGTHGGNRSLTARLFSLGWGTPNLSIFESCLNLSSIQLISNTP